MSYINVLRKSTTSRRAASARYFEVKAGLECFQIVRRRPMYLDKGLMEIITYDLSQVG